MLTLESHHSETPKNAVLCYAVTPKQNTNYTPKKFYLIEYSSRGPTACFSKGRSPSHISDNNKKSIYVKANLLIAASVDPLLPEGLVAQVLGVDIHHATTRDSGGGGVLQVIHLYHKKQ
jgi:hypothetical protein